MSSFAPLYMSNYPYFSNPAHYASHHVARDDRGNVDSVFIENSFQANPPSTATNRKTKRKRSPPAATPAVNSHPSTPIWNPGRVVHFSENSHNVQNTHISNFGCLSGNISMPPNIPRPSTKQAKPRIVTSKVQDEDMDSAGTSPTSSFDEAFSTSHRRRRRSHTAKPHVPSMASVPPVPQPTHYLSSPYNIIPSPIPYYNPLGGLNAMINASVQATMNGVNQVVHERIQAQGATTHAFQAQVEATRAARLAAHGRRKAKTSSSTATTTREDVSTTHAQRSRPCPGFAEYKMRDDAGNTIVVSKLCSHVDCAFLGDNFTPSSQGFSRSSNSWRSPDCNLVCPGSVRHEETDNLGNIKVTSKLCIHDATSKETIDSESDTDVESDSDLDSDSDSDASAFSRAKKASMQPSVKDASDDEDENGM